MENIKIVSDGTVSGTRVMAGDKVLDGVRSVEIEPITVLEQFVTARITFIRPTLDLNLSAEEPDQ